jgi:hypothetical protein
MRIIRSPGIPTVIALAALAIALGHAAVEAGNHHEVWARVLWGGCAIVGFIIVLVVLFVMNEAMQRETLVRVEVEPFALIGPAAIGNCKVSLLNDDPERALYLFAARVYLRKFNWWAFWHPRSVFPVSIAITEGTAQLNVPMPLNLPPGSAPVVWSMRLTALSPELRETTMSLVFEFEVLRRRRTIRHVVPAVRLIAVPESES